MLHASAKGVTRALSSAHMDQRVTPLLYSTSNKWFNFQCHKQVFLSRVLA